MKKSQSGAHKKNMCYPMGIQSTKYLKIHKTSVDDFIVTSLQILNIISNIYLPTNFDNNRTYPYMC